MTAASGATAVDPAAGMAMEASAPVPLAFSVRALVADLLFEAAADTKSTGSSGSRQRQSFSSVRGDAGLA